jgi:hypothetical protein
MAGGSFIIRLHSVSVKRKGGQRGGRREFHVDPFLRRGGRTIHTLMRPASEKRQGNVWDQKMLRGMVAVTLLAFSTQTISVEKLPPTFSRAEYRSKIDP